MKWMTLRKTHGSCCKTSGLIPAKAMGLLTAANFRIMMSSFLPFPKYFENTSHCWNLTLLGGDNGKLSFQILLSVMPGKA